MKILNEIFMINESIDVFVVFIRIVLAALFGGIIGNERGKHGSQAGLRTHILVCLGAAMTSLAGIYSNEVLGYQGDPFRIAAQVVSGIGFLGAGMIIIKSGNTITGLTTAAGMWTTATIGISLGMGFYMGAFLLTLACVFTAAFLTRMERKRKNYTHLYVEICDLSLSGDITDKIKNMLSNDCLTEIVPAKSATNGHLGVYITTTKVKETENFRHELEQIEGVVFSVVE